MKLKPSTFRSTSAAFDDHDSVQRQRVTQVTAVMQRGPANATPRNGLVAPLALLGPHGSDDRLYDTDRGHLIGLEHGGPEASNNLVPMWGHSNRCGLWKAAYQRLADWVDRQTSDVTVTITCTYSDDTTVSDPRIPISLLIAAATADASYRPERVEHTRPVPVAKPDATEKQRLLDLQQEMEDAEWQIEDVIYTDDLPSYRPKPAFPSGSRPYAMLDYQRWKEVRARYPAGSDGTQRARIAFTADVKNTGFDDAQRAAVRKANRALNDGYLVTDDEDDPVRTMLQYRAVGMPVGVIARKGGSDSACQVDHIIPESRAGTNAYSNAQLISAGHNNRLRSSIATADVEMQEVNLRARTGRRASRPPERYGRENVKSMTKRGTSGKAFRKQMIVATRDKTKASLTGRKRGGST